MSSILVLGGAGYIGSHTVYELIAAGEHVVVIDNLQTGFKQAVHPDAVFYQGDIRDRAFLDSVFEKEDIDGVIHFAACSQVGESMTNPLKYYDNNLYGTMVLLQSMTAHGVDKIVFLRLPQHMASQSPFRFLKQIVRFQPTAMVKQNFRWKKCSTGPARRITSAMFPFAILMPAAHIQMD